MVLTPWQRKLEDLNLFTIVPGEELVKDTSYKVSDLIYCDEELVTCLNCWELSYSEWAICNVCSYSWENSELIMEDYLLQKEYDKMLEKRDENIAEPKLELDNTDIELSSLDEEDLMGMLRKKLSFNPGSSNIWPSWAEIFLFCSDSSKNYQVKLNMSYEIWIEKNFSDPEDEWTKLVRKSKIIDLGIFSWNSFKTLNLSPENEKVLKQYLVREILNDFRYNSHLSVA